MTHLARHADNLSRQGRLVLRFSDNGLLSATLDDDDALFKKNTQGIREVFGASYEGLPFPFSYTVVYHHSAIEGVCTIVHVVCHFGCAA